MKHTSVKIDAPIEFLHIEPLNPLISKCQIKVCYVSDKPNRNSSVITKDAIKDIANSLPGCPIVGFYNNTEQDFEEHTKVFKVSGRKLEMEELTIPYGFVAPDAKVWFQKFLDDGQYEHEYLMTEGYLWTGQYPECQRVIDYGNNQSMEFDPRTVKGTWAKGHNGSPDFFIINEAIFSKLCILGEENEPCFEGASITDVQFSFNDNFKEELREMMNELKQLLQKGGVKEVFKRYAVTVGDSLWDALYSFIDNEKYAIDGVYEDETASTTFAVIKDSDDKYFRVNFSLSDSNEFSANADFEDVTETYQPSEDPQFSEEDILTYKKKKEEEEEESKGKKDKETSNDSEENPEENNDDEDDDEKKKKKAKYSLEEIPEYTDLMSKYSNLETKFNELNSEKEKLESQIAELVEFKNAAERKSKEELIASFYMLTDEDKADVLTNIDTYSLDEIEAKLAIICVRNKVSFDTNEHNDNFQFSLHDNDDIEDTSTPAWIKAALAVEKRINK